MPLLCWAYHGKLQTTCTSILFLDLWLVPPLIDLLRTAGTTTIMKFSLSRIETKSKSRSKHLTQGRYECAFIDELPKHLQTECSVCLCVLREPCLVDCCGNRFCRTCIDAVKAERKPCPLCNTPFTAVVLDKQLQRTLNELRVYCSNKKSGCEWTGELGGCS